MRYTTRPLSDHTWLRPAGKRKRSPFDTPWSATLELLDRELRFLKARNIVLEIDVREQDFKLNGELRANARTPEHPAVVVAFESKHGPMLHRCDTFDRSYRSSSIGWQENVRAIAKTLEALRAAERYGAIETGQQYTGFKALPAGTAMPAATAAPAMSNAEAKAIVLTLADVPTWPLTDDGIARVVRSAKRAAHPDVNGGRGGQWVELAEALATLGLA